MKVQIFPASFKPRSESCVRFVRSGESRAGAVSEVHLMRGLTESLPHRGTGVVKSHKNRRRARAAEWHLTEPPDGI
jgi:hypothetical protein